MGIDPISIAAIGATVAGTAASVTGAAMGGGGGDSGRLQFAPEHEIEFIKNSEAQLKAIQNSMTMADDMYKTFSDRMDIQYANINNMIPDAEATRRLVQLDAQLISKYGMDALKGAGYGDLIMNELKQAQALESGAYKDPTTERQIEEGRLALETRMRKALGTGWQQSTAGAMALQKFEEAAADMRQNALSTALARGATRVGIAQAGQGVWGSEQEARMAASKGIEGSLANATALMGSAANIALAQNRGGQEYLTTQSGLRGESRDVYKGLGMTKWTKMGQQALAAGLTATPTVYAQTGVPRTEVKSYWERIAEAQKSRYYNRQQGGVLPA